MHKYIADPTCLPSLLVCCWDETRNSDNGKLIDYLLASMPRSILERMTFFLKYAGRPRKMSFDKCARRIEKYGTSDLESLHGIAFCGDADFDVDLSCSFEIQKLSIYGIASFWNTVTVEKLLEGLSRAFPLYHGELTDLPVSTYQATGRRIEYPILDENPRLFAMFQYYQEAYDRWSYRHGVDNRCCDEMRFLNFVYTYHVLSSVHLNTEVPSDGCNLSHWIRMKACRGTLREVTESNSIWHVAREDREAVVRSLWSTGLFPVSRHFEIVGWDSYVNLPKLAARKSAMEFLVNPGEDLVLAE